MTAAHHTSSYLKPHHAATLFEPLLANAKPSQWTNVSRDDEMMRGLLSAYFSRQHHMFSVFHKDSFLQDMQSGRTDCCSSLLVNTILALSFVWPRIVVMRLFICWQWLELLFEDFKQLRVLESTEFGLYLSCRSQTTLGNASRYEQSSPYHINPSCGANPSYLQHLWTGSAWWYLWSARFRTRKRDWGDGW